MRHRNCVRRGSSIALDIALGVQYLHSRGIVHFDIKSSNVLLQNDMTAKVSPVPPLVACAESKLLALGFMMHVHPEPP